MVHTMGDTSEEVARAYPFYTRLWSIYRRCHFYKPTQIRLEIPYCYEGNLCFHPSLVPSVF